MLKWFTDWLDSQRLDHDDVVNLILKLEMP